MKHVLNRHAFALVAAALCAGATPARAFLHDDSSHHRHDTGCFVTTSPSHHTKGIRHWRNPCPHQERKHLNPYHPGYHRLPPGH
jgi:hypothetical protein